MRKKTSLSLYLLTLFTALATAWAYSTPVDLKIDARGIVRPEGEAIRVVPDVAGRITAVNLREGQIVHEGDVLVQLDTSDFDLKQRSLESRVHSTETRIEQLRANLHETTDVDRRALDFEQSQDAASRRVSELALDESRSVFAQSDRLFAEGLISGQSYDGARTAFHRAEAEMAKWTPDKAGVKRAQSDARRHERELEIESARAELAALYNTLEQSHLETTRLTITSPAEGQISSVASLHQHENLSPGTAIATILPAAPNLIVESWIPAGERAEIHEGQTVRLENESATHTFPGSVTSIGPDSQVSESLAVYRVIVKPEPPGWVRPGMTFRAHFITRQERLLYLLFYRLRKPFED